MQQRWHKKWEAQSHILSSYDSSFLEVDSNPNPSLKCTIPGHRPSSWRSSTLIYRVFQLPALVQACRFSCLFYHHWELENSFGSCFAPKKPVLFCFVLIFNSAWSGLLRQWRNLLLLSRYRKPIVPQSAPSMELLRPCKNLKAPSSLAQPCRVRISAHPRQAQTDTTEPGCKEASLIFQMLFILSLFEMTWNECV